MPFHNHSKAPTAVPRLSIFDRVADRVSFWMGTPTNIGIWIVLVVAWTSLFALHIVGSNANFLPAWFTGTAYNFPLNLVTTVAELYIGFLVAAASNRSERNLETTIAGLAAQGRQLEAVEDGLALALAENTALTLEIHKLVQVVHDKLSTAGEPHDGVPDSRSMADRSGGARV
jgi:low affinity Fe/Cu permease